MKLDSVEHLMLCFLCGAIGLIIGFVWYLISRDSAGAGLVAFALAVLLRHGVVRGHL